MKEQNLNPVPVFIALLDMVVVRKDIVIGILYLNDYMFQ